MKWRLKNTDRLTWSSDYQHKSRRSQPTSRCVWFICSEGKIVRVNFFTLLLQKRKGSSAWIVQVLSSGMLGAGFECWKSRFGLYDGNDRRRVHQLPLWTNLILKILVCSRTGRLLAKHARKLFRQRKEPLPSKETEYNDWFLRFRIINDRLALDKKLSDT